MDYNIHQVVQVEAIRALDEILHEPQRDKLHPLAPLFEWMRTVVSDQLIKVGSNLAAQSSDSLKRKSA